jgi:hypothetical protein
MKSLINYNKKSFIELVSVQHIVIHNRLLILTELFSIHKLKSTEESMRESNFARERVNAVRVWRRKM